MKGTEIGAVVNSMVETDKANGLEADDYLVYVLSIMQYLGRSPAQGYPGNTDV